MNEKSAQALLRFVRVLILATIGAGVANVTILQDVVADPLLGTMTVSITLAVLEFLAKFIGGPTQPIEPSTIRTLAGNSRLSNNDRPNILQV